MMCIQKGPSFDRFHPSVRCLRYFQRLSVVDTPLKRASQRSRRLVQGQEFGQSLSDLGEMTLLYENQSL